MKFFRSLLLLPLLFSLFSCSKDAPLGTASEVKFPDFPAKAILPGTDSYAFLVYSNSSTNMKLNIWTDGNLTLDNFYISPASGENAGGDAFELVGISGGKLEFKPIRKPSFTNWDDEQWILTAKDRNGEVISKCLLFYVVRPIGFELTFERKDLFKSGTFQADAGATYKFDMKITTNSGDSCPFTHREYLAPENNDLVQTDVDSFTTTSDPPSSDCMGKMVIKFPGFPDVGVSVDVHIRHTV